VFVLGTLLVYGLTHNKNFPIWMSTNPKANKWKTADSRNPDFSLDPDFSSTPMGSFPTSTGAAANSLPLYGKSAAEPFSPSAKLQTAHQRTSSLAGRGLANI
jgi:hypothetical protein